VFGGTTPYVLLSPRIPLPNCAVQKSCVTEQFNASIGILNMGEHWKMALCCCHCRYKSCTVCQITRRELGWNDCLPLKGIVHQNMDILSGLALKTAMSCPPWNVTRIILVFSMEYFRIYYKWFICEYHYSFQRSYDFLIFINQSINLIKIHSIHTIGRKILLQLHVFDADF